MNSNFKRSFVISHIAISFLVAIILLLLILFKLFPYPLILLDGTWTALLILLVVDLVLGPLLAWIVISDKKKRRLVIFDLTVIITIQLAALFYGVFNIYNQRIVALVLYDHNFHLVSYKESGKNQFQNANVEYYNGVAYGMIKYGDFDSELRSSIERVMYNPEQYQKLDLVPLNKQNYQRRGFSERLFEKYQGNLIYKIIGKKRNGAVFFDKNSKITDLKLLD